MRREIELASAVEADRSDSDGLGDAASIGRCVRRGGGFGFDLTRFKLLEASSGKRPEAGLKVPEETIAAWVSRVQLARPRGILAARAP